MRRLTRLYGAGPLHALLMLASFAFAGYVVSRVLHASHPGWLAIWLVGAIIAHDFVLFPLYTLAHHVVLRRRSGHRREPVVPWTNYVRVPAVVSGTLLLIAFPLVFGLSQTSYVSATGLTTSPYLGRWLAVAGGLFATSGLLYVARWSTSVARKRAPARRAARAGRAAKTSKP